MIAWSLEASEISMVYHSSAWNPEAERSVCDLLAEMPALKTTLLEMSSNKFGYLLPGTTEGLASLGWFRGDAVILGIEVADS